MVTRIVSLLLLIGTTFHSTIASPKEVVVVANINSQESIDLALHYLKLREVPSKNLILIDSVDSDSISGPDFVNSIWNPLRKSLIKSGFIEGILSKKKSKDGRYKYASTDVHFKHLVLCKGLPYKVQNDPHLNKTGSEIPAIFRTTCASVDSELAFISVANKPRISSEKNPLFGVKYPSSIEQETVISVCRLDGPTYKSAKHITTSSIAAEKTPLLKGRAYIDQYPSYEHGNTWLQTAADHLQQYGFEVDIETTAKHWDMDDRNDAPAIYLGWYKKKASGPALYPGRTIPTGAIAAHIHSFSASTLSKKSGWVGSLIESGFAVSFGNVYEPYLELTLRPDMFIEALLLGKNVGEASLYATPVFSWQNITLGDPLYTPFPSNENATDQLISQLNDGILDPYVAIITLNRIAQTDRKLAKEYAIKHFIKTPSPQIAYKIITDYHDITCPTIISSLKEYLSNTQMKEVELIPIYLDLLETSFSENDPLSNRIKEKLSLLKNKWPVALQKRFKSMDAHHSPDKPKN